MSLPTWRRLLRRLHALRPRTRGQALVEFAIILPVFLLFLVVAIDAGRLFFSYVEINNAAREGAAYGAANPTNLTAITARAGQETNSQSQRGENAITVTAACADTAGTAILCSNANGGAGIGNSIKVTVAEPFTFLTPFISGIFGGNLQMQASASAIVLGFAPSPSSTSPAGCSGPTLATFTVVVSGLQVDVNPSASQPDNGICAISGYNWDWGDGDSEAGSAVASSHTYTAAATYTIELTITNQGGSLIKQQNVPVGVAPPTATPGPTPTPTLGPTPSPSPTPTPTLAPCTRPVASFTYTRSGAGNKTYNYNDTSTVADPINCPITAWLWEFDDGQTLTNAISPIHTYATGGNHKATLTVTNAGGSSKVGPQ